jgi:GT2 family glycosyltransferase
MISVVMTYYQRQRQLTNTFESFKQYNPNDFNVIIVDDNSPKDIHISPYPFDVTIIKLKEKHWICPAPVFNFGFIEALKSKPDAIIIQNSECYHNGNILEYIKDHLIESNYLSFAAYSLGKGQDVDIKELNAVGASGNGDSAWYNHSVHRPGGYHFCCAITSGNLCKLNGFDERFSEGLGYEDDYLIHQVQTLGLKIEIIDDPFVFHQYHYDVKAFTFNAEIYNKNAVLCTVLKRERKYRAVHYITPDLI